MADALSGRLDQVVDTILARGDATAALTDAELAPLARLAAELRHYPDPGFRARLRATLKERATMTTTLSAAAPTSTTAREGFTTITPYITAKDESVTNFLNNVGNDTSDHSTSILDSGNDSSEHFDLDLSDVANTDSSVHVGNLVDVDGIVNNLDLGGDLPININL